MPLTVSRRHHLWYSHVSVLALCLVALLSVACGKAKPTPIFPDSAELATVQATAAFDNPTERIVSADTTFSAGTNPSENAQVDTATITPIPTPVGPCTWNADYIEDGNLEDGFLVQPAIPVHKVWHLVNNGTCPWIEGISLEIVAGEQLHILPQSKVTQTASGMIGNIELDFISPGRLGEYATYLRMRSPDGDLFGSVVFVKFSVSNSAPSLNDKLPDTIVSVINPTPTPVPVAPAAIEPPATATEAGIGVATTPVPTVDKPATATPTPIVATIAPTDTRVPTETPSATATDTPTETATVAPSETPDPGTSFGVSQAVETCDYPIDFRLEDAKRLADINSLDLGDCASGTAKTEDGQYLEFITTPNIGNVSLMLWQSSGTVRIFRGYSKTFGNLMSVRDAGIPLRNPSLEYLAACAASVEDEAPDGFVMPTGYFGYLWCEQELYETLRWSLDTEKHATLVVQNVPNGVLMQVSTPSDQPLYNIAVNTTTGEGIIMP